MQILYQRNCEAKILVIDFIVKLTPPIACETFPIWNSGMKLKSNWTLSLNSSLVQVFSTEVKVVPCENHNCVLINSWKAKRTNCPSHLNKLPLWLLLLLTAALSVRAEQDNILRWAQLCHLIHSWRQQSWTTKEGISGKREMFDSHSENCLFLSDKWESRLSTVY